MMRFRASALGLAAAAAFAAAWTASAPGPEAAAQDQNPFDSKDDAPSDPNATDASTPLYRKAIELQKKGKWKDAQAAFRDVLKKFPDSVHKYDCEQRGGDNCYMGTVKIHESGPPSRRIDVTVMGDGFQVDDKSQKQEEEWANLCLSVLWSEASFEEYKDYFNYYYVRLVSKDEGVDKVETEEERKKREEKNRKRSKDKPAPNNFSTALDCKAAGPQGQVLADRDLVYHWLGYANNDVNGCADDALVIAFAKFGQLGMGGGGVANVGRPDKSVTVHEFGHAFVGLLDEYANNPGPPGYAVRAPNATSDPKVIPWQHFLDKKVDGVGVHEGGATFKQGVWRPAPSCAMNAAGATGFCPVCREASVLRIYSYVSPIDTAKPDPLTEIVCVEGDKIELKLEPMRPRTHDLAVEWTWDRVPDSEPGPEPPKSSGSTTDGGGYEFDHWDAGGRARSRNHAIYDFPVFGAPLPKEYVRQEKDGKRTVRHVLDVSKLERGRYMITARVTDPTPWVLKDPKHLLEERVTWWVRVQKKPVTGK
ncbi:MAG: hypothetical protein HMLKMBBP_03795 [Planctomycetes bacterium]|nr:hypothetical protein [Planctomycetota bacterium]